MSAQIRVVVTDLATGESDSCEITDNYVLITAGSCYQSYVNASSNGTHTITVRGARGAPSVPKLPELGVS